MSLWSRISRRFTPTDGDQIRKIYGGGSHAGKSVNDRTAMQLSAVWCCVRLISETVATLPLSIYKRNADGGRDTANDHPIAGLLRTDPNADQTSVEYWEGNLSQICLHGNSFSEKRMIGNRLVALEPIRDITGIERKDGAPVYLFNDRGKQEKLPADKVFHIKGFGAHGDLGLSPISYARHCLGGAMAIDEAAGKMFSKGLFLGGILSYEKILNDEQRAQLKKSIIDNLAGTAQTGGTMLLEAGMKYERLGLTAEDAEMLASRRFTIEEICRWYGVPTILCQHAAEGQTMWGSGIEQIMIGWTTLGLRPYLKRIEAAINKRLLSRVDRQQYYAEFNIEGLLRGDSAARAEFNSKMVQNGIFTRNEVRMAENRKRLPGGDELTVQSQMVQLDQLEKVTKGK